MFTDLPKELEERLSMGSRRQNSYVFLFQSKPDMKDMFANL